MYEYADKIIKLLHRYLIRVFPRIRALTTFDEINVLDTVNSVYSDIDRTIHRYFQMLAERAYGDAFEGEMLIPLAVEFLQRVFSEYNPVSKYVYINEFDRKRLRLVEALIATGGDSVEADRAMKQIALMIGCYAIAVVDEATLEAYRQEGVDKVRWVSEDDSKVCSVCRERNGNVYPINELPPKPHYNCRCYFERVK